MPGLPIINSIQRVALVWQSAVSGATAINVMHFSTASTDTLALKNLIDANVTAAMWNHTVGTVNVKELHITPLDGSAATAIYPVTGTKWAGTGGTGDILPAVAAVVSLRTAVRGRQNRGRLYLPFVWETGALNGAFSSPPTGMQTAWDTFRAAMKTGLMPMHVASYGHGYHKSGGKGSPIVYTPVTWAAHSNEVTMTNVELTFGTMRPRQSRLR